MNIIVKSIIQVLMGTIGSFGFSILYNIRGKKLILAGLGGLFSWSLCLVLQIWFESEVIRYFLSAAFVAVYAEALARIMKTPTTTFLVPAIIPHVPGGSLYYTMKFALNQQWYDFFSRAFYTVELALALAMGIIAISSLVKFIFAVINKLKKKSA
ncbi:MAG: threonine/serine exporter family protein [Clostridia bacterium]|nr:threonine/serine exporter family protein [Clostridia bacterium]